MNLADAQEKVEDWRTYYTARADRAKHPNISLHKSRWHSQPAIVTEPENSLPKDGSQRTSWKTLASGDQRLVSAQAKTDSTYEPDANRGAGLVELPNGKEPLVLQFFIRT